jgi:hypothetical protein
MANTYELISSNTVGSGGAASVTFSSIAASWTDLIVKISARATTTTSDLKVTFNGATTSFSDIFLYNTGSATNTYIDAGINDSSFTANTFSSTDLYIPNYLSSNYKSTSLDYTGETNGAGSYRWLDAGLWSNTAAITSITFTPTSGNIAQYSSFYLYGIKNS